MENWIKFVEIVGAIAGILAFLDALVLRWKDNQRLAALEMIFGVVITVGTVGSYLYITPGHDRRRSEVIVTPDNLCSARPCVFEEACVCECGLGGSG